MDKGSLDYSPQFDLTKLINLKSWIPQCLNQIFHRFTRVINSSRGKISKQEAWIIPTPRKCIASRNILGCRQDILAQWEGLKQLESWSLYSSIKIIWWWWWWIHLTTTSNHSSNSSLYSLEKLLDNSNGLKELSSSDIE